MNPIEMIIECLMGGNNPDQMVQQLLQQNPELNAYMGQMKQNNMSPKEFLNQYAKQNNINVQPLINMLQKRGIKF